MSDFATRLQLEGYLRKWLRRYHDGGGMSSERIPVHLAEIRINQIVSHPEFLEELCLSCRQRPIEQTPNMPSTRCRPCKEASLIRAIFGDTDEIRGPE